MNFKMSLISKNPYTEEVLKTFHQNTKEEVEEILEQASKAFLSWKNKTFKERAIFVNKIADVLEKRKDELAKIATLEMGRTITAAQNEIGKCVLTLRYYAENSEKFLEEEKIQTEAKESVVRYEPLGTVLAVMPWNFPFWQVFRFLAPVLMAGNVAILKHASNVPQCGEAIENVLLEAGIPKGVFKNLKLSGGDVLPLLDDDRIVAVAVTGSEKAGGEVASRAGKNIKRVVLELGGSDSFIVCEDANLEEIVPIATGARLQNAGQTCVAAKRFIVHESLYEDFLKKMKVSFEEVIVGDPMLENTVMGPLATENIRSDIETIVEEARSMGATIITGGNVPKMKGYFYPPTIITDVKKDMPIYHVETFGPVAVVFPFKTFEEAIGIANDTRYGLGASVWTKDIILAERYARALEVGSVFVNQIVKSDPRLPFGGIKKSGLGRELSSFGIKEFTNVKTVWIS